MAHAINNYDKLYSNMKENLTVANSEYTLGEYMLMKAAAKKSEAAMPVAVHQSATHSEKTVAVICKYVEDKLTVKKAPKSDSVIHSFPIRTAAAAFLSAIVVCSFIISFGIIGTKLMKPKASNIQTLDVVETEVVDSTETTASISE